MIATAVGDQHDLESGQLGFGRRLSPALSALTRGLDLFLCACQLVFWGAAVVYPSRFSPVGAPTDRDHAAALARTAAPPSRAPS